MTLSAERAGMYTKEDFTRGTPEEILEADKHPKVLVVWPHGDETLGPSIGHHIYEERPELWEHVDYMCGNPRAAQADPPQRYVESDLNRSFNPEDNLQTYEGGRAQQIMSRIAIAEYDYVLDIHTSTTKVGRFFLASRRNEAVDKMVAASPITRIAMMPENIARAGLIGQVQNSISVEYDREVAKEVGVEESMKLIDGLISGRPLVAPTEREFFYVTRTIPKTEDPGIDTPNFELCDDGYYPVLFGENTYRTDPTKDYLGFAATSREVVTL